MLEAQRNERNAEDFQRLVTKYICNTIQQTLQQTIQQTIQTSELMYFRFLTERGTW